MSKKIALTGVFAALAMIFGYIEAILPLNLGIPGVKLGVANIAVVVALFSLGTREAAGVSLVRIVTIALLFGNISSLWYSLSGGVLSLLGMIICKRLRLSIIGVSAVGGVLHNIGQLAAASILLQTPTLAYYLPVLQVSGLVTGLITGTAAMLVNKATENRLNIQ